MADHNQPENVKYFNYLGSTITNDARCTYEIKSKDFHGYSSVQKKTPLFASKLDLNYWKKLAKCYI